MKYILSLVVLIAVLSLALADFGYIKPKIPECKRKLEVKTENNKHTLKVKSEMECENISILNRTKTETYSKSEFTANVDKVPYFKFKSSSGVEIKTAGDKKVDVDIKVGAAFGIDRVIEYEEKNGVDGYQAGNDTLVNTWKLRDLSFTQFIINKTDVSADGASAVYSVESSVVIPKCCTLRITAYVTTDNVEYSSKKLVTRAVKQILTPTSMKTEIALEGITYSKTTTRVALGSFVVFRGKSSIKGIKTRNILADVEKPEDASNDQKVVNFDSDIVDQALGQLLGLPKQFFSFQTFTNYYNKNTNGILRKTLVASDMMDEDIQDIGDAKNDIEKAVAKRMWFSVPEQLDNFNWDPTVGSEDTTTTSSASRITIMFVPLILVIASLLFLL
ncbi:hypothetical protein ABK040_008952 [Willaertia magna]